MNNRRAVRQSNFELLRIISIIMILFHHLTVYGVEQRWSVTEQYKIWSMGEDNRIISSMMEPGGEIGVALFFMITGYFLANRDNDSFFSILRIVRQLFFYALIIGLFAIGFSLAGFDVFNSKEVLYKIVISYIIFPFRWWFANAYLYLLMIIPFLNRLCQKVKYREFIILLVIFWIWGYMFSTLFDFEYYSLNRGVFFYLFGMYIRKTNIMRLKSKTFFIISILLWIISSFILYHYSLLKNGVELTKVICKVFELTFTGILAPLTAITIFGFFKTINIMSGKINVVSKSVFGIYLLHEASDYRAFLWKNLFHIEKLYMNESFLVTAIGCVCCLFIVGLIIDSVRRRYISPIGDKIIDKIYQRIKL